MKMTLRFYVQSLTENAGGSYSTILAPDYKDGANKEWSKYTPAGSIQLTLSQGVAIEFYRDALRNRSTIEIEMTAVNPVT